MEPHTALLCDAHVWILAGCPICALEREIITREGADRRIEKLEGAIRDHKLSTWSNLITDEDRVLWEILDDTRGRDGNGI